MRRQLIIPLAVGALVLTGCAGQSGPASNTEGELTTVKVGTLPVAVSAALVHGDEAGIFEKHGLDLELQSGQAGTGLVTAVVSGSIDIAFSAPLSVVLAHDKGLPVSIISGFSNSNASGDDTQAVIVREDSGVSSFADLEGKEVAVNAIETQGDLSVMEAIDADGGDPSKVAFIEIPFPEMQAQLANGNVDAAWTPDPFMGRMLADDDFQSIGSSYQASIPGQPTQVVFAGSEFVDGNPEVVESFRAALDETLKEVELDPSLVRDQLPEFLQMDPAEAEKVVLGRFDAQVSRESMDALVDLMVKYGLIEGPTDLDELIKEGE